MIENVITISPETIRTETAKAKKEGYKFVTLSGVELNDREMEILYHFDRDYQLRHFRLIVAKTAVVPSISNIYQAAFLAENEIQDLFAIFFSDLVIDFKRTLFLENCTKSGPMCRYTIAESGPEKQLHTDETTPISDKQRG